MTANLNTEIITFEMRVARMETEFSREIAQVGREIKRLRSDDADRWLYAARQVVICAQCAAHEYTRSVSWNGNRAYVSEAEYYIREARKWLGAA